MPYDSILDFIGVRITVSWAVPILSRKDQVVNNKVLVLPLDDRHKDAGCLVQVRPENTTPFNLDHPVNK